MKKFLINVFSFLLVLVVVYIIILVIWGLYAPSFLKRNLYSSFDFSHLHKRLNEANDYGDVELLFLGSSHSYRGFDTRNFLNSGFKSFNLGSSSQTPIQTEFLVNKYLKKLNPEIVIFDVYPDLFANNGLESTLDLIVNEDIDISTFSLAFKVNSIPAYNTLIFHFVTKKLNIIKLNNYKSDFEKEKYISGGFVERDLGFYKPSKLSSRSFSPEINQIKAFSNIVEELKVNNIKLILVYVPITKNQYNTYVNNEFFDSLMISYGTYYNFNELIFLNDSLHFYDSHHLNQDGVNIFNSKLIEILAKESKKN